jgi:hypothetical protein
MKRKAASGRGKQTTFKCRQSDLPLSRPDAFWNIIRSEMWRFKIRVSTNICFYMF